MSLLEQYIIRKGQVNKLLKLEPEQKLDIGNDKEYKVKAIHANEVYIKEITGQLLVLYD